MRRTPIGVAVSNKEKTDDIQSIIIAGRTGSGKSTLANVLSNNNKFAEVAGSTSGTKRIQSEIFEWKGNKYRVIDTVGIGDTAELSNDEKMSLFLELLEIVRKHNVVQIIFVYKDRFEEYQIKALEKVNTLFKIYGSNSISKHIALVCTNFDQFENKKACDQDIKKLHGECKNKSAAELIKNCKHIHVDNPSICSPHYRDGAIRARQSSRKKLLNYLAPILSVEGIKIENAFGATNVRDQDIYDCF
ncbi:5108_t:CDS:1 [Racocetra fulgida]|uniref:5108_t:CDS:1 n=1 Tax=Racocetra fulgida TaxID=60492 RepID=A0A9N8VKW3_9GLOM|nr:5108_t:CDS:1 [Racocetra fulgida]